jgi:DNA-binding IclR family transcriptional regulator
VKTITHPKPGSIAELLLNRLRREPEGLTSHRLAELINMSLVTVSPQLRPLERGGLVMDAGKNHENRTVWKHVP